MDVALVTCAALPGLHADDRYLLRALRARGLKVEPVVWEDRLQEWADAPLTVIRSAWDYSFRRAEFLGWAERAAAVTALWNPLALVRWNTHKRYLCDLAARGVAVVPTILLPAGQDGSLDAVLDEQGWGDAVVKAAVAQSGRYAAFVPRGDRRAGREHLARVNPHEDMLVQPYIASVPDRGELSLVYIDGRFTHAIRKRAPAGEFRVHDDYGGSTEPETPDRAHLAVAEAALLAAGEPTLYARIDLVEGPTGPMIMEFEVVEPELFLRFSEEAVRRFADAIEHRLLKATRER